jgi:hypothetical protein
VLGLGVHFRAKFLAHPLAFGFAPGVGVFADFRGELFLGELAVGGAPGIALLQGPLLDVRPGGQPFAGGFEGLLAELVDEAFL